MGVSNLWAALWWRLKFQCSGDELCCSFEWSSVLSSLSMLFTWCSGDVFRQLFALPKHPTRPPVLPGNPIGKLQEMTQKKYMAPPTYEFQDNGSPPHEREYLCTVKLLQYTSTGKHFLQLVSIYYKLLFYLVCFNMFIILKNFVARIMLFGLSVFRMLSLVSFQIRNEIRKIQIFQNLYTAGWMEDRAGGFLGTVFHCHPTVRCHRVTFQVSHPHLVMLMTWRQHRGRENATHVETRCQ